MKQIIKIAEDGGSSQKVGWLVNEQERMSLNAQLIKLKIQVKANRMSSSLTHSSSVLEKRSAS